MQYEQPCKFSKCFIGTCVLRNNVMFPLQLFVQFLTACQFIKYNSLVFTNENLYKKWVVTFWLLERMVGVPLGNFSLTGGTTP